MHVQLVQDKILAKKWQFKYAHFLLQQNPQKVLINPKNGISTLLLYKRGYYLTKFFNDEMCLFEIVEIIVKNDSSTNMFILSKQIKILNFHLNA